MTPAAVIDTILILNNGYFRMMAGHKLSQLRSLYFLEQGTAEYLCCKVRMEPDLHHISSLNNKTSNWYYEEWKTIIA